MKASLGCGLTLNEHLLVTHWIIANSASVGMRQCLESHHPVRRLMHTFVFRTGSVNFASTLTLLPAERFVHRASGFKFEDMARCVEECAESFKFEPFPVTAE